MVWPGRKLRLDALGRALPEGQTVTKPGTVGAETAVTLRVTAVTPVDGNAAAAGDLDGAGCPVPVEVPRLHRHRAAGVQQPVPASASGRLHGPWVFRQGSSRRRRRAVGGTRGPVNSDLPSTLIGTMTVLGMSGRGEVEVGGLGWLPEGPDGDVAGRWGPTVTLSATAGLRCREPPRPLIWTVRVPSRVEARGTARAVGVSNNRFGERDLKAPMRWVFRQEVAGDVGQQVDGTRGPVEQVDLSVGADRDDDRVRDVLAGVEVEVGGVRPGLVPRWPCGDVPVAVGRRR